jgi:hypothetical protein
MKLTFYESQQLAGASSCKQALVDEEVMAVRILGTNANVEWRSVVAP